MWITNYKGFEISHHPASERCDYDTWEVHNGDNFINEFESEKKARKAIDGLTLSENEQNKNLMKRDKMEITNYKGFEISFHPAEGKDSYDSWEVHKGDVYHGEYDCEDDAKARIDGLLLLMDEPTIFEQLAENYKTIRSAGVISVNFLYTPDEPMLTIHLSGGTFKMLAEKWQVEMQGCEDKAFNGLYREWFVYNNIKYFALFQ